MAKKINGLFNKAQVIHRIHELNQDGILLPPYNLACFIAFNALIDQTDKAGKAYAHHLVNVSRKDTNSETKMTIGILHDLVEDSDWSLSDLENIGFSKRIVSAVDALTIRKNEKYFDFIERCSNNSDALEVKLNDNHDNLDGTRKNWLPDENDIQRQRKYTLARLYLLDVKKSKISPGTAFSSWIVSKDKDLQDFELIKAHSSHKIHVNKKTGPSP
jgi:(p)ppGpp synthase/HD superfamily hydrolase